MLIHRFWWSISKTFSIESRIHHHRFEHNSYPFFHCLNGRTAILLMCSSCGCSSLNHFSDSCDASDLIGDKRHCSSNGGSDCAGLSGPTNPVRAGIRIGATSSSNCSRITIAFRSGVHSVWCKGGGMRRSRESVAHSGTERLWVSAEMETSRRRSSGKMERIDGAS
jgi:hypothetical protein